MPEPLVQFRAIHKRFGTYVAVKSLDLDLSLIHISEPTRPY